MIDINTEVEKGKFEYLGNQRRWKETKGVKWKLKDKGLIVMQRKFYEVKGYRRKLGLNWIFALRDLIFF